MRKTVFIKLALVLAGAFLFATVSHAQSFTTVTATVTDSNGIPYAGGTMSATLTPGTPGGWTLNGQPYSGTVGPVTLDSTGTFIANFGSNAVILPASTQWEITVGSNPGGIPPPLGTGAQSFSVTITISGATQNISGTLNASAPKLTNFTSSGGSGTVTTIATTGPITGGPITTTGTIACPTCVTASGGGSVTIAANQIGFGSGTNAVIGSSNFTYSNPGGSCGLTAVAALTQCGDGAGSFNSQAALNENIVHGNGTQWNQVYSNSDGTGNTGTTRETFLSMQMGNATFGDEFNMEMTTNGHDDAGIEFGGSRVGRPSGVSGGLNFDGNGDVEIGVDNSDSTQTEWKVIPNGDMQLITETGKNLCFEGTSTGEACVGVAATAGTPNPIHWPTTTGTAGQVLSSNGANPQQLVWITPSGGGSVSNQVLRGISANSSGTPTVVDSVVCTPPATNGAFTVGYTVAASVAVAPTCPQVGVASASISGATATYTVGTSVPNDASGIPIVHDIAGSSAVAVTLPTPTTLANTNAVVTYENRSAFTDTITPTTFTIQAGTSSAGSSIPVPPGTRVQMTVDQFNANRWLATIVPIETATNGLTIPGQMSAAGGLISAADGVHAGYSGLVGNTANFAVTPNTVGFMGPTTATFTGYALQLPGTGPTNAAPILSCATPSSLVSACIFVAAGGTGTVTSIATTSPITGGTITGTGTIACATCTTSASALTSNSIVLGAGSQAEKTVTAFTTDGAQTLTIGVIGGGNGILALAGNTSGTATFTAPAVAGTRTNPIAISNAITVPVGADATPSINFSGSTNYGFELNGTGVVTALAGVAQLAVYPANIQANSTEVYSWTSATATSGALDTGLSRDAAGVVDVGTGAQGNIAGKMRGALFIANGGTACANGNFALSAGWGSTAAVSGAAGFSQTCEITVTSSGTGQATGATVTWTLPTAIGAATTVCTANLVGGTITGLSGTGILLDNTTLSSTAPVFTFAGLPVTSLTTKIVFRCGP